MAGVLTTSFFSLLVERGWCVGARSWEALVVSNVCAETGGGFK